MDSIFENETIAIEVSEGKAYLINKVLNERYVILPDFQSGFIVELVDKNYKTAKEIHALTK